MEYANPQLTEVMKCILSPSTNPYFNLAAEEYLLHEFHGNVYFQYVNDPSVVVGKHQNAMAEVDIDFLEENNIILARRISGGGAVYHDQGNVNFSFLTDEEPGNFVRFKKYTEAIIAALGELGLNAELGSRNQILLGKDKISGTASHVYKTRVLHHGTLLYDTDLEKLSSCLYVDSSHMQSKAVQSIRSVVTNIGEHLNQTLSNEEFYKFLFQFVGGFYPNKLSYTFQPFDILAIENLVKTKFTNWEWNFGYSPKYAIEASIKTNKSEYTIQLKVEHGKITELYSEAKEGDLLNELRDTLVGQFHQKEKLQKVLFENTALAGHASAILKALF